MEEVDIGLCEETLSETSPDFDEAPHELPAKKCRQRKALTKKERESLMKEVRHLLLSPLTTYCLDVTRSKLVSHANQGRSQDFQKGGSKFNRCSSDKIHRLRHSASYFR